MEDLSPVVLTSISKIIVNDDKQKGVDRFIFA